LKTDEGKGNGVMIYDYEHMKFKELELDKGSAACRFSDSDMGRLL
jgi:hypothetical protein